MLKYKLLFQKQFTYDKIIVSANIQRQSMPKTLFYGIILPL